MTIYAEGQPVHPEAVKTYTLYMREDCWPCKKVLNAIERLKIQVHVELRNTTTNPAYRDEIMAKGGTVQHPYLWNNLTQTGMYESDDIVAHFDSVYGQ